ncbi:reverse transcriptase domain-containing protein [Streptomyces sp. NBC_00485]|nr:reverse transcriptase domain-containing protein [Streptomyces sp. NBC_00474]
MEGQAGGGSRTSAVGGVLRANLQRRLPRFPAGRGCNSALRKIADTWQGTTWFVEGDIADCFGSLDHDVMMATLAANIHDGRFLRLIRNMLQAGYLEDWIFNATLSGSPQGGVASPVLSNIYLDRLDTFIETVLIPEYTRGISRRPNRKHHRLYYAMRRAHGRGDQAEFRNLRQQLRALPSSDPQDSGYRRLRYIRYADDTLLGFIGPKAEAEEIKARLAQFLRDDLKLELSPHKTLITHARTEAARFLGYEITAQHSSTKITNGRRSVNGVIRLRVPIPVINAYCSHYLKRGKPAHRSDLFGAPDRDIVRKFGAEYRGIIQYYLLANDVYRLTRLHWVMETSLLKTLAGKHRSTVSAMARKYRSKVDTPVGPRVCFQVTTERPGRKALVVRFGGIPLRRQKTALIIDKPMAGTVVRRRELVSRLLAGICEICGSTDGIAVHHVRGLADLSDRRQPLPSWVQVMLGNRRKALVACRDCHTEIHADG